MRKKLFIFDLDGVIVDTAKYHFLAWKNIATELDIDFTIEQNELLKGVNRENSLLKILEFENKSIELSLFNSLLIKKNNIYLRYVEKINSNDVIDGIINSIDYIKKNKHYLALGSASKNAQMILRKLELFECFDIIIDGTITENAKPNPEVFLRSMNRLKVKPEDCIVFEDSISGITAANTAGMTSIGIGNKDVLFKATHNFSKFNLITNQFLSHL